MPVSEPGLRPGSDPRPADAGPDGPGGGAPPQADTPTPDDGPWPGRKRHSLSPRQLIRLVPKPLRHAFTVFLILLVLEYLVIPALLKAKGSLSALSHVNAVWLVAGVGFEAAALVSYGYLTRTLSPVDGPGLWTLLRIDMSTLAVSHIVPGGTASGSSLGYRLMTAEGVSGPDAGFTMATQGIGSAVVLNVLLWFALVISIPLDGIHRGYVAVALAGVLLLVIFAGLIYLLTLGEDVAARILRAAAKPIPWLNGDKVEVVVRRIGARIRLLGADREQMRRAITWAALNWLFDAASLWAFVFALGHYVSPINLFVAYGVGNVLAAIPLTPGGLGVVEVVVSSLLVNFGLTKPANVAYLAVVGWRLINFWLPIPIGAGMYISLRVDREQVRHIRSREALAQLRTLPEMSSPVEQAKLDEFEEVAVAEHASPPRPDAHKVVGQSVVGQSVVGHRAAAGPTVADRSPPEMANSDFGEQPGSDLDPETGLPYSST